MNEAVEIEVLEVEFYERDTRLRMPFKFGVVTMTQSPQCFAHVLVRLQDGSEHWGVAAEILAPKWFDKNLELSNEDNYNQLRRALRSAGELYTGAGRQTPFGLFSGAYDEQIRRCGEHGDGPLVACYGPALLDRAVLDAVCRGLDISFFQAVQGNVPGLRSDEFDIGPFLAGLKPAAAVHARHTVGMLDPITHNPEPVGDGLPETLAEVIETYGQRYFKIKVGGDMAADVARLREIAAVLDTIPGGYHLSLDGNEQYTDVAGVAALLDAIEAEPALQRFNAAILFLEQPIARSVALDVDVGALSARIPVIIDESDATLDAFPRARALGYRGVSSKSCKGLYKSILNAGRCAHWGEGYFMSGEDLTTQAGVCVQQDLALASLIGLTHIERNGHHYVNGFAGAGAKEEEAFLAAHPDMYHRAGGTVRLTIEEGKIAIGSLDRPGFAVGAAPDFAAMKELTNG